MYRDILGRMIDYSYVDPEYFSDYDYYNNTLTLAQFLNANKTDLSLKNEYALCFEDTELQDIIYSKDQFN